MSISRPRPSTSGQSYDIATSDELHSSVHCSRSELFRVAATSLLNLAQGHAQPASDPNAAILETCRELNRAKNQFAGSNSTEAESRVRDIRNECSTVSTVLNNQSQRSSLRQSVKSSGGKAGGRRFLRATSTMCATTKEMKGDPSKSACRCRFQTAPSGCGRSAAPCFAPWSSSGHARASTNSLGMAVACLATLIGSPASSSIETACCGLLPFLFSSDSSLN